MTPKERADAILEMLEKKELYTMRSLADSLGVSVTTVRRDLEKLAESGAIIRNDRGVTIADTLPAPLLVRDNTFDTLKKEVCAAFSERIRPQDTLFLSHSRTLLNLVPFLRPGMHLTVFTNGLPMLRKLAEVGIEAYLIGGEYYHNSESFLGDVATANIRSYHFNKTVLSPNGVVPDEGLFTEAEASFNLQRAAIACADEVYALGAGSKVGRRGTYRICGKEAVTEFIIR